MRDTEIRWHALVPVAILTGFAQLFIETSGVWGGFPARPEALWCLAFYATLHAPPAQGVAAFFVCGVLRDLLLGAHPGAGAAAYTLMGWIALHWSFLASSHGWPGQAVLAGWAGVFAAMIRHALDYGELAYTLLARVFFLGIADGLLTGAAYLPLLLVFGLEQFRPCRERSGA